MKKMYFVPFFYHGHSRDKNTQWIKSIVTKEWIALLRKELICLNDTF